MASRLSGSDYGQYGLKSEKNEERVLPTNVDEGCEVPGFGPVDTVDATGHRVGNAEEKPGRKSSSRLGAAAINEADDKKR